MHHVSPPAPPPQRGGRRGLLRVLDGSHAPALLRLCERDPVANVFVTARVLGLLAREGAEVGGAVWGWFEDAELVSACWAGANLVPIEATPRALDAFAERARTEGRRCSSLVGPADAVLGLWSRLEGHWRGVREVRSRQPLMLCDGDPAVEPDAAVRRSRLAELDIVVPACVAMFTEEIGYPPSPPDGGTTYRARVADLVAAGRSFVRVDDSPRGPEVVFKAELGAVASRVAQVQGVWVAPHRRGEGLSVAGMAAVVAQTRAAGLPLVSLYVNDYNARAVAAYRRVGFREVGTFATVLF
ncbi:GNAT family N-acetyltransferase [Kineococcus glutinatus]|uniref:GNAT family N-acetyltransferase n=1 Tax=Kineococcus glutinatus TaxID=1070872 RepID=A0ABP9I3E7_9ACTN